MTSSSETRFTLDDVENRPFAVEIGYDEWATQAGWLLSHVIGEGIPLETRRSGDNIGKKVDQVRVWATEACRGVCEQGFRTRSIGTLTMPSPYDMARSVLGDEFTAFQHNEIRRPLKDDQKETARVHARFIEVIPRTAEVAFL